ncbi:uncharacterized protein LOC128554079, partial [Mercenaria mercenaria]|uniref:uncharacterized protein LOC128554079 n=1 Tax=Mercenaria mercenaria TaxID=6596 RepID=UPI00234F27B1
AGPSCDMQSVDMAGGSGENMREISVTEGKKESHPEENMENGAGEKVLYRNTSSEQVKKSLKRRSLKRRSDERAGCSEEKIIKTEEVKDNKRSVKNKQDLLKAKNLPKTESSKNTNQVLKKKYVPTAETEKDPKTKQFQETTNQPKTMKVPLSSASANQKEEKEDIDQRNNEDDKLDGENSEIKFPLVSSRSQQPSGSFIDSHGHVETVLESGAKVQASYSVCKIYFPTVGGNADATGFRVGSRYIMTAAHVTNAFSKGLQYAAETYAQFNYKLDGIFREEDKYLIKGVVYSNKETDIAVIELLDHPNGFPPSLTAFSPPCLERGFYLIGHSQGSIMKTNFVNKIVDKDCPKMQHTLGQLREMSLKHTSGRGYDTPPYDTVDNPYRFLFQCKFSKGASGAPGIVLIGGTIYVTTVLLHGYPDWYYDTSMETYKSNWLPEHCVQQGVNLMCLRNLMQETHSSLCQDIFGIQQ